jgi:hypothetical protein
MSDKTQDTNRTMLYLLGVVVVLLVVIVALVVVNGQTASQQTATNLPAGSTAATGTQSMPGINPSGGEFDAKTASKVTAGVEPKAYVTTYYQSILDKKWDVAFQMQPAASKAGGDAKGFGETQTSYGWTSFTIGSATTTGDTATVVVNAVLTTTPKMSITWTFKKVGADWYVVSRQVAMGQ